MSIPKHEIRLHELIVYFGCAGELMTNAAWIRKFVLNHPDYKQDSIVSERINYDLICKIMRLTHGEDDAPELLGERMKKTTK